MKVKKILIVLLIPIILASCSDKDVKKNDDKVQNDYSHVKVKNIEKKSFNKTIDLVGQTEAYKKITISSDLNEKVIKNNISVGDVVKKDDILFKFDKTNYQLNYDSAKNTYENSLIELKKINDIE
ncbi:MAG: biotin/lipoyl-binding protein, partial [Bacillota bacterium]